MTSVKLLLKKSILKFKKIRLFIKKKGILYRKKIPHRTMLNYIYILENMHNIKARMHL